VGNKIDSPFVKFRKLACVHLKELAKASGVSEGSLKAWHSERRPSYATRLKVYRALVTQLIANAPAYGTRENREVLADVHDACEADFPDGKPPIRTPVAAAPVASKVEATRTSAPAALAPSASKRSTAAAELTTLKGRVAAALRAAPALVRELIDLGYGVAPCDDIELGVAASLLAAKAQRVAVHLADLHASPPGEHDRRIARDLLFLILPHAVDWEEVRREAIAELGRAASAKGRRALPLRLLTATVAEIVLAGVDGRPAQFSPPEDAVPVGVGSVALPPVWHAPLFEAHAEDAVDDIVDSLAREREGADRYIRAARKSHQHNKQRLRSAVNQRLADRARPENKADYLPHYLLLIEDALLPALGDKGKTALDALAAHTVEVLGRYLPALRIVRLQADEKQFDDENAIVLPIWHVCAHG
jgi:transcriptional regulator with XRE-family HTH domain